MCLFHPHAWVTSDSEAFGATVCRWEVCTQTQTYHVSSCFLLLSDWFLLETNSSPATKYLILHVFCMCTTLVLLTAASATARNISLLTDWLRFCITLVRVKPDMYTAGHCDVMWQWVDHGMWRMTTTPESSVCRNLPFDNHSQCFTLEIAKFLPGTASQVKSSNLDFCSSVIRYNKQSCNQLVTSDMKQWRKWWKATCISPHFSVQALYLQ